MAGELRFDLLNLRRWLATCRLGTPIYDGKPTSTAGNFLQTAVRTRVTAAHGFLPP